MKTLESNIIALAVLSFFGGVTLTIVMGNAYNREELLRQEENEFKNQGNTFIWNDDWESIPTDGSLVRIEFTENDTIYIGSAE
jgi:hypothetical protein